MSFARPSKNIATPVAAAASVLLASMLAGCAGSAPYSPLTSTSPMAERSAAKDVVAMWSRTQMRVQLPGAGCFKASYPSGAWTRIACVTPADMRFSVPRKGGVQPAIVGNGADYTLISLPNVMSAAIGSFPTVDNVTGVRSIGVPAFGGHGGRTGPNVYSLQLNSNVFSTASCAAMKHCVGWEQFVFTNQPNSYEGGGNLIIQDWLLSTNSSPLSGCPAGAGWQKSDGACVQNGPNSVLTPSVPISELRSLSLSGSADSSGDSAFLAVGSTVYGEKTIQGDGIVDLSQHWTGVEFNVVGNGGGNRARFNKGATITVSVEADTGSSLRPGCRGNSGSTGESNSLSFVAPPTNPQSKRYPSIVFTESNVAGGGSPSCEALPAIPPRSS